MKKKRSRWIALALLGTVAPLCLFYFRSDTKRWSWIGVPEDQPFGNYVEEPAAPGSGPAAAAGTKAKEIGRNQSDSAIHGEVEMAMSFANSNSHHEPNRRPVDVDPAVLDAIGDMMLATFNPVSDSLLDVVGSSFQKLDPLGHLLLGSQNLFAETRERASETASSMVERMTASQSRIPENTSTRLVDVPESRLRNLVRETQASQSTSVWNDAEVGRGAATLSSSQVVSPQLGSPSTLSDTTRVSRSVLPSLPRH